MNYQRIYEALMASRKQETTPDTYHEKHHILPRSLGGGDDPENLVILTGREHYLAHWLLAKIHGGSQWAAVWFMSHGRGCNSGRGARITARQFEAARKHYNEWAKVYFTENNPFKGKQHSEETIQKIKDGRVWASGEDHHGYGVPMTEEQKAQMTAYRNWTSFRETVDLTVMHRIHSAVGFECYKDSHCTNKKPPVWLRKAPRKLFMLGRYFLGINAGEHAKRRDSTGENNPNWGNDAVKGEANGRYIEHIWLWRNKKSGKLLECTSYEAYTKHGMSKAGVSNCINGLRSGVRDWLLIGAKHPLIVEPGRLKRIQARLDEYERDNTVTACPYCGVKGKQGKSAMIRYHFDNCKHKVNAA